MVFASVASHCLWQPPNVSDGLKMTQHGSKVAFPGLPACFPVPSRGLLGQLFVPPEALVDDPATPKNVKDQMCFAIFASRRLWQPPSA